jgi:hypothetical protein
MKMAFLPFSRRRRFRLTSASRASANPSCQQRIRKGSISA